MIALCHWAAFLSFLLPLGNLLGPLAVWLWKRKSSPEFDEHGKESVNFQISMTLYILAYTAVLFGIMLWFNAQPPSEELVRFIHMMPFMYLPLIFLGLLDFGLVIWAAIRAHNGKSVQYPLRIRFIH